MLRQSITMQQIPQVLGGSFAVIGEYLEGGIRTTELEGSNGRQVQTVADVSTRNVQAFVVR